MSQTEWKRTGEKYSQLNAHTWPVSENCDVCFKIDQYLVILGKIYILHVQMYKQIDHEIKQICKKWPNRNYIMHI